MMSQKSILVLDDNQDLRGIMCELFDSYGGRCTGVGSVDEMKTLAVDGRLAFDVAILDVNLGPGRPSGLDAYRWLRDQSFPGQILLLTGHAYSFPGVAEAHALGVRVLQKPVSIEELVGLLGEEPRRT
jgi:DNA-binding response OmpR family regulator